MGKALVSFGWRFLLGGLVSVGGLVAAGLAYQGVLAAISLRWVGCIGPSLSGGAVAVGVFLLCRHRNDLICD
jgi:hypothetical protein